MPNPKYNPKTDYWWYVTGIGNVLIKNAKTEKQTVYVENNKSSLDEIAGDCISACIHHIAYQMTPSEQIDTMLCGSHCCGDYDETMEIFSQYKYLDDLKHILNKYQKYCQQ